ncbi:MULTISPECIES: GNAT family N-acetyltransferase [unclassified Vibrio]|uniref:GNAT family N-acetyltransferase n=1 Tax=unclassified Vibrio TaxID=2614977 RepID=UPI00352E9379
MTSAINAQGSMENRTALESSASIEIKVDDLSGGEVIELLEEHLADMYATSPAESVHALDLDGLKSPEITFFSAWKDSQLLGCVAIKELNTQHAELKSMRTSQFARKSGVASQLLQHVLDTATARQYQTISLETGSEDYFKAARNLYEKFGFGYCEPFADYVLDPHSQFMRIELR